MTHRERSGNPGYLLGKPVLYGSLVGGIINELTSGFAVPTAIASYDADHPESFGLSVCPQVGYRVCLCCGYIPCSWWWDDVVIQLLKFDGLMVNLLTAGDNIYDHVVVTRRPPTPPPPPRRPAPPWCSSATT
jgi:hypothetical protein